MLCYKDKTFCPFWESCQNAEDCPDKLTEEVLRDASQVGLFVMQYIAPPKQCYVEGK